jgi:ketosteroid isomerase-like protein
MAGKMTLPNGQNVPAATIVSRFNAAWNDHDLPAALALTSNDCVFESTSPAPDGERFAGRAAIRAAWKPIFDDEHSHFTFEDFFTAGPRVVQRWRYDWGDGHVRGVDVITVKDGLVTEKLSYVKS